MNEKNGNNLPDSQIVELLHDMGKMPDWAYYQLNGKSAQENYADQKRKNQANLRKMLYGEDYSDVHFTSEVKNNDNNILCVRSHCTERQEVRRSNKMQADQ